MDRQKLKKIILVLMFGIMTFFINNVDSSAVSTARINYLNQILEEVLLWKIF